MVSRSSDGFRGADSRRRYLSVYDRIRSLGPKPNVIHDVPTEYGIVRAYQHGTDGGVPMVLLPCFWGTSAMWADRVAALVDNFTVHTVDLLGQPGASVQFKPMVTANHCVRCINEVLRGRSLHNVHLVGHSYGGWTYNAVLYVTDAADPNTASNEVETVIFCALEGLKTGL